MRNNIKPSDRLEEFRKRFHTVTNEELIEIAKKELKNRGWVRTRAIYLTALREEFKKRGLKYPNKE